MALNVALGDRFYITYIIRYAEKICKYCITIYINSSTTNG